MGIPHIHQKLEDNGAACFWGRIESVSASNGQPTVYRWVDEINDRDYLAKCVADGAYAMWMPRYNLANGGVPSDNRFNMVVPGAGSSYQGAQLGLSTDGPLNWGRMIVPALAGQNVGFYGESGDLSPLARRTKAQQTYPNDSPKPEALPGSWSLEAQACFVAEHAGSTKIVESFPFTLECWAKPTAANVGEFPTANGKPGCALMVAPPNNPESPNTAISAPGAGWKCWGVGFKDDSTNPGVPVVFWGGWEGHDALYQAGPDPGRTKYPTSSSNPSSAEWQHVVAVFHSASHVQLFWNGREVGNYNNSDFTSFRDQDGSNQAWSGKTVTDPSSYSYSQAPGLTAWMGGCNWFYDPGGGSTPTLEKQFPLTGKFAFPAVYRKALSNREVMHHFLTCRQAANITLRGEAQDYSGSAPQGVLKVERTKVSGLGRSDQILIYKDQITTGQASMEIPADGKAAIQQCGLPDPFPYLSGVTDDRRYHDGTQGGFTGYCIAGAIGAIFDSSIATIANGFMAPMSWIGRPQWGVSGQELSTPTGMQVPLFSSTNNLQRNAFLYADLQDPKNAADRATGTVRVTAINSSKDSRLGTQVFSAKYENGQVLEIGTQHEPELAVASSTSDVGTLRLADSSGDGAWDYLTLVSGTETPLVIGPHALIGSPMPTQTVIRMLGGTPKLRSRQATGLVRRHYEINNMPPATRQAGNKTASQAPASQTTIGTLSISGPQTANEDTATSFSVSRSGNSNTITYAWSCSPSANVVASAANASITFPDPATTYTVSVTATDSNSSDTPKSASQQLTTNAATDWDTHEVGAFVIPRLDSSAFVEDFDHQFPLDAAYNSVGRVTSSGSGSAPYVYVTNGAFGNAANQIKAPPYVAVWVSSEHDAAGGYGHNDDGWYVFKRNGYSDGTAEGGTPADNNRAVYIPHAWKSGANNNDGYLGIGGSDAFPFFVVNLDDYSGSTGSGGTDSWTDPFDWSSPNYTMTATLVATASSNFSLGSVSESGATADWEPYTYQPLRGGSQYIFILMKVSSGGSFSSGNDFFADTKLQHARLRNTTSGSEYDIWTPATGTAADQYIKVVFGDSGTNEPWGTGTLTYLRWLYNSGDGTTTFAKFSAGDTIQLDLFYTDDT